MYKSQKMILCSHFFLLTFIRVLGVKSRHQSFLVNTFIYYTISTDSKMHGFAVVVWFFNVYFYKKTKTKHSFTHRAKAIDMQ